MKFWLIGFSLLAIATAHAQGQAGDPAVSGTPTPIQITATQGIEWRQTDQEVIATGNAKAVRGDVTVKADRLIAHYRKKASAPSAARLPGRPTIR